MSEFDEPHFGGVLFGVAHLLSPLTAVRIHLRYAEPRHGGGPEGGVPNPRLRLRGG
jgi:hypothetical protein